jgi:hypothetical protein
MITVTMTADQGFSPSGAAVVQLLVDGQPLSNYTFDDSWVQAGDAVQVSFPFAVTTSVSLPSGQYHYEVRIAGDSSKMAAGVYKSWRSIDYLAHPVTFRNNNDFGLGEGFRLAGVIGK